MDEFEDYMVAHWTASRAPGPPVGAARGRGRRSDRPDLRAAAHGRGSVGLVTLRPTSTGPSSSLGQEPARRWWRAVPSARLPDSGQADANSGVLDRRVVHQALAPLTPDHREVLVLSVGDLSEPHIAEVLAVSVARSRAVRARSGSPRSTTWSSGRAHERPAGVRSYFDLLAARTTSGRRPSTPCSRRIGLRGWILAGAAVAGLCRSSRRDALVRATVAAAVDRQPSPTRGPVESQSGNGAWWTPGAIRFGTGNLLIGERSAGWCRRLTTSSWPLWTDASCWSRRRDRRPRSARTRPTGVRADVPGRPAQRRDRLDGRRPALVFGPTRRRRRRRPLRVVVAAGDLPARVRPRPGVRDNWRGDRIWDWTTDLNQRIGDDTSSYIHGVRDGACSSSRHQGLGLRRPHRSSRRAVTRSRCREDRLPTPGHPGRLLSR